MTVELPIQGGEAAGVAAAANLHMLTVNLAAMKRLLGRRTGDGMLVQADPALIEAAIAVGREEVRRVRMMLVEVPYDPADPWRHSLDKMVAAVAELDGLLDTLQDMLSVAGD